MFHMCTLGECLVWMEQMLGESVELSELGNVLCGSELVLGECFSWTAGEDDTHSGLTRLHVCLLSCEICDCLPSVTKCYQVLPSVAMVLPWCCHGDSLFTLFPQVCLVLKWWLAVGDGIVGSWLLAQIQPIRLLYLPMDHHLQSNTICFTERVIKSHRLMTVPIDTCVCKHSPECW